MTDDYGSGLVARDLESLRKRDDLDRRRPTRLSGFDWLREFVQAGLTYKPVPDEFWTLDVEGDVSVAIVACPCGQEPHVELAAYPVKCECERWFFFGGTEVLAFCSPS